MGWCDHAVYKARLKMARESIIMEEIMAKFTMKLLYGWTGFILTEHHIRTEGI